MRSMLADAATAQLFTSAAPWADMGSWHEAVAELRRCCPVVRVEEPGFEPFWVLTRHADILAVSRDDRLWRNTPRSVLGPDADWERVLAAGIPVPKTLVHLDGQEHADHRRLTSDWFKPASVKRRQPRIDTIADLFVARMRELGGRCDFARDVAQPTP